MGIRRSAVYILLTLLFSSCVKGFVDPMDTGNSYSRVLTIMCLGNNNGLTSGMKDNLRAVYDNPLPLKSDTKAVLVYEHLDNRPPMLKRLYSDWRGAVCIDTLLILPESTVSTTPGNIAYVLSFVRENFPSDHYGLLLSSHGTGWLPKNYYNTSVGSGPRFKSFGAEIVPSSGDPMEIELTELNACIPFHCDYIIFDACLMGGVEVAYELKDATDKIVFSSSEILSIGYQYDVLVRDMMKYSDYALEDFCRHFFEFTEASENSSDRSCTISCVRTDALENLAAVCKPLFGKYREELMKLGPSDVQGFFRDGKQWFFDLEDMLYKSGISPDEKSGLDKALGECVTYRAHTERFLNNLEIHTYCGLSSYLTGAGNDYLDGYYSSLAWNKATDYVTVLP